MKLISVIVLAFCLVATAYAQSDEKPVQLSGILSLRVFPGRPNYESIKEGDETEWAWILTTSKNNEKEEFQLLVIDGSDKKFAALRRCMGKKIMVEGSMWEANTGHHHTPFLITVLSIKEEPNTEL